MTGSTLRSRHRLRRGFTLVELMIVVAMVGVLAALGLVGYRRYMNAAQGSEAKAVIQMIRGAQETYKSEMLTYLNVSSTIATWYPQGATPSDKRFAWVNTGHADWATGWSLLNIQPDGPVRFGYASISGVSASVPAFPAPFTNSPAGVTVPSGTTWYEVMATNKRQGATKQPVFAATSLSGELLVQDESE